MTGPTIETTLSTTFYVSHADLIVVGAGFFGLTIAERAANEGFAVVVLERRDHIGGNAWSSKDPATGIDVHRYGSHIFHTSNQLVWEYVQRFGAFNDYRHHVWACHNSKLFSMPITLATLSQFYGYFVTPEEGRRIVAEAASEGLEDCDNSLEGKAIRSVGRPLYEALIRGYTLKQWQTDPRELPSTVIDRLPVRFTYDTRYFSDPYEGIPVDGYGSLLENMASAPGIHVCFNVDWLRLRHEISEINVPVVYSGALDRYFADCQGPLSWRTLDFELDTLPIRDFQGTSVVNFADAEVPFTRIHEFKHYNPGSYTDLDATVIMREYSRFAGREDEPYYPVANSEDRRRLAAYRTLVRRETGVLFGGRLGTYKYLDMHMAIASALSAYSNTLGPELRRLRTAGGPVRSLLRSNMLET